MAETSCDHRLGRFDSMVSDRDQSVARPQLPVHPDVQCLRDRGDSPVRSAEGRVESGSTNSAMPPLESGWIWPAVAAWPPNPSKRPKDADSNVAEVAKTIGDSRCRLV